MNLLLAFLSASPVALAAMSILGRALDFGFADVLAYGPAVTVILLSWCVTAMLFHRLAPIPNPDIAPAPETSCEPAGAPPC